MEGGLGPLGLVISADVAITAVITTHHRCWTPFVVVIDDMTTTRYSDIAINAWEAKRKYTIIIMIAGETH